VFCLAWVLIIIAFINPLRGKNRKAITVPEKPDRFFCCAVKKAKPICS
jgi:hypothetical protein